MRAAEEGPTKSRSLFVVRASSRARQAKLDLPLPSLCPPFLLAQCSHTFENTHTRAFFLPNFHHLVTLEHYFEVKSPSKTKFSAGKKYRKLPTEIECHRQGTEIYSRQIEWAYPDPEIASFF